MKRIGMVILTIALSINLCMGVSCVLADNTRSKTSADGQFQYHLEDWDNDGNYAEALLDKYLGSKSTLDLPETIDGYEVWYYSEDLFRSMKTVTTVVFQKPVLDAAYAIYAPKLQSIQVLDFGNTDCFIYDGCLYGPYYFDPDNKRKVISECMMWGAPGGKETINLYKDVDMFTDYFTGGPEYLETMENLKAINVPEENKKYKSINGILLNKEGTIVVIPNKVSAGKTLELPAGVTKSDGYSYNKWEKVVFPEGMKEYTAVKNDWEYGDLRDPSKKFNYDELLDIVNSEGPKALVFPSTLTVFGCETRDTVNVYGEDEHGYYGNRVISTRIETSVKDVYLNMSREKAKNSIQIKDLYSDDEYKINTLDAFFDFNYPNATIHYLNEIKTDSSIKNGTVTANPKTALYETTITLAVKANEGYQLKKLAVMDETGKEVKVKDNQFTMPDSDVTITAEFEKKSNSGKDDDNTPVTTTYTDVPVTGKWYSNAVYYATEKGYMAGTGNNKFSPEGTVTRGTIAQILYAAENKPTVTGKSKFSDVASGKWYANAVNWAADKGLVTGYGNGKFGPDDRITREQMVAIMMQYSKMKGYDLSAKADLSKYPDQSKISKWALNAMKWGVSHKIISGTDKGLEPKGNATRAQIAVILQAYDKNLRK